MICHFHQTDDSECGCVLRRCPKCGLGMMYLSGYFCPECEFNKTFGDKDDGHEPTGTYRPT